MIQATNTSLLALKPWIFVIAINALWLSIYRYCLVSTFDWELVLFICFINIPISIIVASKIRKKLPVLIFLIISLALFFLSKRQTVPINGPQIPVSHDQENTEKSSAMIEKPKAETLPIHERLEQFKKNLDCEKLLKFAKESPSTFKQEEDAINLLNKCQGRGKR